MTTEPAALTSDTKMTDVDEVGDLASPGWQGEPWPIDPARPPGQSFRARHDHLRAIEFLLSGGPGAAGDLLCHLHEEGPAGRRLHTASLDTTASRGDRFARFTFPPLPDSAGRRYYAWLAATGDGLGVYTAGPARLGDGVAFRGHAPADGCLVFRTFAAAPDARWADQRRIEALLGREAELTRDLLAARQTIRRLTDERDAVEARLRALLDRLLPPAPGAPRA